MEQESYRIAELDRDTPSSGRRNEPVNDPVQIRREFEKAFEVANAPSAD